LTSRAEAPTESSMRIGEAAAASGVTVKGIRHYEAMGMLPGIRRAGSYRELSDSDVERLKLIAHCRRLGFSLPEIGEILHLVSTSKPECPPPEAMDAIVEEKIRESRRAIARLEQRAAKLHETRRYLAERMAARRA